MGRLLPRTTKSRLHVGAGLALVVAMLAAYLTFFAKPADAHHALIEGQTVCSDQTQVVQFEAESWNKFWWLGGANPHIDVAYRIQLPNQAPGAWVTLPWNPAWYFADDNNYEFSGSFSLPPQPTGTQVQLEANPGAPWSLGYVGADPYPSAWIPLLNNCGPTTTTTTTTAPTTTTTAPTTTTTAPTTTTTAPTTTTTAPTTTTTAPTTTTTAPTTTTTAPTTTAPTTTTTAPTTTTTAPTTTTTEPTTTTSAVSPTSEVQTTTTTVVVLPTSVVQSTTTTTPGGGGGGAGVGPAVLGTQEVQGAQLPATGSNTTGFVVMGGALLVAGLCLVRASRLRDDS